MKLHEQHRIVSAPPDLVSRRSAKQEKKLHTREIRLAHLNVRSLVPSLDDVNVLLADNDLDILCVTETWLQPDLDSRFLIFPGYKMVRADRPARNGSNIRDGGICILNKSHLRVERIEVPSTGSPLKSG